VELPKASKKISPNILSRLGLHTTVSLLGEMSRARKRQAPTMMATGQIASVALLARRTSDLVVDGVCRRTTKAARAVSAVASLIVTPATSIAFSGPQGGPFSPSLIEYRISASTGTVSYSIRTPSWLTASSTSGVIDAGGVAITLRVNASASSLPPGTYGPAFAFTNVSNGRGSATRPARLTVRGASLPRPTGQVERGRGGYLLDGRG
jgi:hypothetical protein